MDLEVDNKMEVTSRPSYEHLFEQNRLLVDYSTYAVLYVIDKLLSARDPPHFAIRSSTPLPHQF